MTPEDELQLPPLAPFDESTAVAASAGLQGVGYTPALKLVTLSNEQFAAVLTGVAPPPSSAPRVSPSDETTIDTLARQIAGTSRGETGMEELNEERLSCYTQAAALRYSYRLDRLSPLPLRQGEPPPPYSRLQRVERNAVFAHLTGRSSIVTDRHDNARWLLNDDERRRALKLLVERGMVQEAVKQARSDADAEAALDEATAPGADGGRVGASPIELILWDCLLGEPIPLELQDTGQLMLVQRVAGWLHGLALGSGVPNPEVVAEYLARETLLQSFRHLTGEWKDGAFTSYFIGRRNELRQLYDYLNVLPPETMLLALGRALNSLGQSAWNIVSGEIGRRPLLIYGPGGVGKSALLARFLLDHLTKTPPRDRFPYSYLDFDLSALDGREPLTLLAEAGRQLAAQYPSSANSWNDARRHWLAAVQAAGEAGIDPEARRAALQSFARLLNASAGQEVRVAEQFARKLPFLLVLDTFEEMQYDNRDAVRDLFRFLNEMRKEIPALRVILMGRARLDDVREEYGAIEAVGNIESDSFGTGLATNFDVVQVLLDDLEPSEARDYLLRQGLVDPMLAEDLVAIVGGNPLSLRLMARLLQQGDVDLSSLRAETEWRPGLAERLRGQKIPPKQLLQGVLFRRILGHIHDPNIAKLAHPGLVLRVVTPDLIKVVLAGPCGLGKLDDTHARRYFDELAKEVALVGTERDATGAEVLRHRPELRRVMLRLMQADESKQQQIEQIHENAARYYEAYQDRHALEEALYHRLMLADPPRLETLADDIPTDEAIVSGYVPAPTSEHDARQIWYSLSSVAEEFPPASAAYLAARLNHELAEDADWQSADRRDWELLVLSRTSYRARELNRLNLALDALRRDRDRMTSRGGELSPLSPLFLIEVVLLQRFGLHADSDLAIKRMLPLLLNTPQQEQNRRRVIEYRLLEARAAAHLDAAAECEARLAQAMDSATWHVPTDAFTLRRARQVLRVASECCQLQPTESLFATQARWLLNLMGNGPGVGGQSSMLHTSPVLARYVVACAAAAPATLFRPKMVNAAVIDLARGKDLLMVLLDRLPSAGAGRLAGELSAWATESADTLHSASQTTGPALEEPQQGWSREVWLFNLLTSPIESLAPRVANVLADVPIPRLVRIFQSLMPLRSDGSAGEDALEEARRAGDLMPGEGPGGDQGASAGRRT